MLRAIGRLAGATGVDGMVGGQYLDVTERAPAGPEGLRRLHALKTGRADRGVRAMRARPQRGRRT